MVRSDETTDFCQPRIIVTSAVTELWPELLGIQTHGTKLVYIKWTTEPADTLLLEDGTSSIPVSYTHLERYVEV